MMKLDIGCGLHTKKPLDEWTHLDIDPGPHIELVCDFGDIPLDSESVSEIWIGDVIEHVPVWRQAEVLVEWRRILKPGGTIAGNTPNLDYNVRGYVAGNITLDWLIQNLYGDRAGYPHQHYILFTMGTLTELFNKHGFIDVDFSNSPGPRENPSWLVFSARKA
jgi:predicted SAM-dependent methyltransferase